MAVITVVKKIGASQTYSTPATWEADAPVNLTTAAKYTCGTFSGAFSQGETVTGGTSGFTAKMLDTDSSSYMVLGDATGTFTNGETLTGGTSTKTCVITTPATDTGIIWEGDINASTDGFSGTGTQVTFGGSTSSTTCYKFLTAGAGASFVDTLNSAPYALDYNTAKGCYIQTTSNYNAAVNPGEDNSHVSRIQTKGTATVRSTGMTSSGVNIVFNQVISSGTDNTGAGGVIQVRGGGVISNSLAIKRDSGASGVIAKLYSGPAITNCTFVSFSDLATPPTNAIGANYGTLVLKNCAIFGCTNATSGSSTISATTCMTDAATPPSGFTTVTYTSQFTGTTSGSPDFREKTGANLIDAGTTVAAGAVSINGVTRSTYDIGAWEDVASGVILSITHYAILLGAGT